MKNKVLFIVGMLTIVCLVLGICLYGNVGISAKAVEKDARKSQQVDTSWQVIQKKDKKLIAMLFYDKSKKNHTFSIYQNWDGYSFGYFFVSGGGSGDIELDVDAFPCGNKGIVIMSMNKQKIARMIIEWNNQTKTVNIDDKNPFVQIVPPNCKNIILYDVDGKIVPQDNKLFNKLP